MPDALRVQRMLLAACIALAPLSITLYLVTWPGNLRQPLVASAAAGLTGNVLHFIGGVTAAFFLPIGYLGMALLGMRRAPGFATLCAALSLIGWIPWAALMGPDALAFDINQLGASPERVALWAHFNGDVVMSTFLLIYVVGHLLSAVLIGIMLGRLRLVPAWAAWAFALSSPVTIALFPIHNLLAQDVLKYLVCALLIVGAFPAALAMLAGRGQLEDVEVKR
ncbi:MAG TPA: hypothetical protein VIC85_06105 [Ktedonobacterales bacterium]|jgi:hypothetical protein